MRCCCSAEALLGVAQSGQPSRPGSHRSDDVTPRRARSHRTRRKRQTSGTRCLRKQTFAGAEQTVLRETGPPRRIDPLLTPVLPRTPHQGRRPPCNTNDASGRNTTWLLLPSLPSQTKYLDESSGWRGRSAKTRSTYHPSACRVASRERRTRSCCSPGGGIASPAAEQEGLYAEAREHERSDTLRLASHRVSVRSRTGSRCGRAGCLVFTVDRRWRIRLGTGNR
jgi:hypothetical protein